MHAAQCARWLCSLMWTLAVLRPDVVEVYPNLENSTAVLVWLE